MRRIHHKAEPGIAPVGALSLADWLDTWARHGERRLRLFASLGKAGDLISLRHLLDAIRERVRRWNRQPGDPGLKAEIDAGMAEVVRLARRIRRYDP
jgi:hypothetical protein